MSKTIMRVRGSLTGYSQSQVIEVLLDTTQSVDARGEAALRLGSRWGLANGYDDRASLEPLLTTLDDDCSELRAAAAEALGNSIHRLPPAAVAGLTRLLDDEAPIVRSAAVLSITSSDDAVPLIVKALRDPSAEVRADAAFALGVILTGSAKSAIPALEAAKSDPDSEVRKWVAEALILLRSEHEGVHIPRTRSRSPRNCNRTSPQPGTNEEIPF